MNALSLFAIYLLFLGTVHLSRLDGERPRLYINIALARY